MNIVLALAYWMVALCFWAIPIVVFGAIQRARPGTETGNVAYWFLGMAGYYLFFSLTGFPAFYQWILLPHRITPDGGPDIGGYGGSAFAGVAILLAIGCVMRAIVIARAERTNTTLAKSDDVEPGFKKGMVIAMAINLTILLAVYVAAVLYGTEPLGGLFWGCAVVSSGQLIYIVPCLIMKRIPKWQRMALGMSRIAVCTFIIGLAIAYALLNIAIDLRYR